MYTVLLHMHDDVGQRARAIAALELARALPAHLLCLQTIELPTTLEPVLMPPSIAHAAAELKMAGRRAAAELQRQALEADLTGAGLSIEWHQRDGDAKDALSRYAALSDLVVVSLPGHPLPGPSPLALAAEVALDLDVPIVAVPPALASFDAAAPAIVAWDGSQAAGAALRGAIPLLRRSALTTVVTVNAADSFGPTAEEAFAYLQRAGVKAAVRRLDDKENVAAALLEAVSEVSASCLVMGMYGRGRTKEFFLGGVTASLIPTAPIPLLLAH